MKFKSKKILEGMSNLIVELSRVIYIKQSDKWGAIMGIGIIICGLYGAGKSTLGKALAEKLNFHFIDNENLYFPKTDPYYLYSSPRTHEEAEKLLLDEIKEYKNFVLASVKGDYKDADCFFQLAVWLDVPKEIRIQRVKHRSFQKFGKRMMPGGDLYQQEKGFFDFVESRKESTVEEWLQSLTCPVIRIDGREPVEVNIQFIVEKMRGFLSSD